jgi:hypothetical protein
MRSLWWEGRELAKPLIIIKSMQKCGKICGNYVAKICGNLCVAAYHRYCSKTWACRSLALAAGRPGSRNTANAHTAAAWRTNTLRTHIK